jgi:hypothetical protein
MPGLVPAGPQQPAGAQDVALFQHIDGQTSEEDGEPGHRLGPGQADLEHAVFGAVDPRRPGVQVGEELAAVEVAPLPFLRVVVGREIGIAHGTGKPGPLRMVNPHVDPASLSRKLDPAHLPR